MIFCLVSLRSCCAVVVVVVIFAVAVLTTFTVVAIIYIAMLLLSSFIFVVVISVAIIIASDTFLFALPYTAIPTLLIGEGALKYFFSLYKKQLPNMAGYITDSSQGTIHFDRLFYPSSLVLPLTCAFLFQTEDISARNICS